MKSSKRGGHRNADQSVGEPVVSDRHQVDKGGSAKSFGRKASRTKAINVASPPMRGGIRL